MIKTAYCKINLTLEILGTQRNDGFHDLKSVMHKIPLGDIVELDVKPGKGDIFFTCDSNVCESSENLAYLAAKSYIDEYAKLNDVDFDIYINLKKVTPTGAGLGGGSADAACVLDMLSETLGKIDDIKLEQLASALGSDVVFCLDKYMSAYCTGRGEKCRSIALLPESTSMIIAKPNESLNTKGIYKDYDELFGNDYTKSKTDGMEQALKNGDIQGIEKNLVNDFEPVCIPRLQEINSIKQTILSSGAYACQMSGSGSAVFGLFEDASKLPCCKNELEKLGVSDIFAFDTKDFEKMYKGE